MSSVRILIVDDNQTIRRGIRSLVSSRPGWVVCGEAADGLEAVQKTKEMRPDVVLMDISMPRMNGIEATRIIQREVPQSLIIVVSQNDPTVGARQAAEIGARGYVAKSEISRTLQATISGVIGQAKEPEGATGPTPAEARSSRATALKVDRTTNLLLRDAAEPKLAERASSLLAAIVDSSDDAIISKNLDGVITSWNSSAERMFGYTAEEAIGKHITIIIPPDRRVEETHILEQVRQGKRVEHFETIRMRKDGTMFDISLAISPVRDETGRAIGASKVARDISERKSIDRALRDSEEKLRSLAEGLETQVQIRTQELEKRNAEVLAQSALLRELSNRLLMSQDDERRRIARELHDSAGQVLTALGISLSNMSEHALRDPELAKELQAAQEMLQALNKEIRTMSYLLHPPLLDENGLLEALRWYTGGLSERSGLQIELSASESVGRLPCEVELTLFRIVQECLTNIHRHSGSKTASIRLEREGGDILLEIQDEGRGIPAAKLANIQAQRSGVGLSGIRERVRHLHGVVTIASGDSGTKISVTLPVSKWTAPVAEEVDEPTRAMG